MSIKTIDRPVNAQLRGRRIRPVVVAPPPAEHAGHPAPSPGLVGTHVIGAHREWHLHGRIVVGPRVKVPAERLDRDRRGARETPRTLRVRHVHAVSLQRQPGTGEVPTPLPRRDLAIAQQEARARHGTRNADPHRDATRDGFTRQRHPRRPIRRILDRADHRRRLILQHRVQRVRQAGAAVLAPLDGRGQARPVLGRGRLLLRQGDNFRSVHLRMHLTQRRNHGRRQRRRLRRAVQVTVGLAVPTRQRRVDLRARSREINRRSTPVRPGRRLQHAGRRVRAVGQLQRRHREGTAHHRRQVHAALHVPLVSAPRVPRRRIVGRGRVIQVRRPVAGSHHVNDVLRRRIVGRTLDSLQARRLLRVARHPVLPRVHVVRAIRHRNPVLRGPHEAAHDVLGVEVAAVARRHVDRSDCQRRIHTINAHAVMLRGNRPGHVRPVGRVVPAPRRRILVRDAVHVTSHRL